MVRNSIWVRIAYHVTERFMSGRSHTREIDGAVVVSVNLIDHVLQLRLGRVLAQRAHNGTQLLGGDLACSREDTSVSCRNGRALFQQRI